MKYDPIRTSCGFCGVFLTAILFATVFSPSLSAQISKLNAIKNPSLEELREGFQNPHRDYSTGPLWTWNDRLTEEQVRSTLRDLASQNVKQVWVHPRPGLMTPYLSEEWFTMWKTALLEAEKLDMNVWIYDENSYPSGFAGGFVPEALPESRGMGLRFEEVEKLDKIDENIWYVFAPTGDSDEAAYNNITEDVKKAGTLETGYGGRKYLIGRVHFTPQGGWFGGKWYVDLLRKGVTEKFIELTFEAYKNVPEIRKEFGNRVPGIFTDEPHPAGSYVGTWVSWNEEIPELFEKKFGYSLIDNLPSLHREVGDWKKVRHNYHQLILDLFVERWARPCFEWCEANNLEFTGHYWEHGWPGTSHGPDNMAMYIWHQRPAIDLLMNQYNDSSPNAQFGNVRSVKELASIANQMGRSRTLSENYGAGGWDLRFEDMKRLGDWSYALGVNTNNEHLSYVTLRGARKRDHPQSFSYHASWFEGYHVLADYFTRLSYVLSQGRQVNRVLVIEPTTTAWMYQGTPELGPIGQSFTDFVNALERAQVEYDLGSEDTIARFGKVEGKTFAIHQGEYDLVILPPKMENVNRKTADLLAQYVKNGGELLCAGDWPSRINGSELSETEQNELRNLPQNAQKREPQQAVAAARERTVRDGIFITTPEGTTGVFHHRRRLPDCEILFLCNSGPKKTGMVSVAFPPEKHLAFWTLENGEMSKSMESSCGVHFAMPPGWSSLLVLSDTEIAGQSLMIEGPAEEKSIPGSDTTVQRLEPNVLTLDYVDVKVGEETRKEQYTWKANRWIFEKHEMDGNPWDNCVQFKDELISKTFPENSGFTATYKFQIAEKVPADLNIVIERADLYEITCNGQAIKEKPGDWWLDKSFYKIDLSKAAKPGENEITITARSMSIYHELEPAYLLGDFSLENAEKGFLVVPPKPLQLRTPEPDTQIITHSTDLERVSWLSKGIGFHGEDVKQGDAAPYLVFDLGEACIVNEIEIWNYSERNLTKRGVQKMGIYSSPTPNPNDPQRFHFRTTTLAEGSSGGPQIVPLADNRVLPQNRYIIFEIKSNHNGTTYPIVETELEKAKKRDNAFVGLSEVRFYKENPENPPPPPRSDARTTKRETEWKRKTASGIPAVLPVDGVKIATQSSELVKATHDRKAAYVLDGSGLEPYVPQQGWNVQGMPFYSGKVLYGRTFSVDSLNPERKYYVQLPDSPGGWYGATAQVLVDGKSAGFFTCSPWMCDVTKFLKPGENRIEVIVYATPKNLLGPHHAGRLRGSAWPGSFRGAPETQPPGSNYDTIGYGLFEPFTLVSITPEQK